LEKKKADLRKGECERGEKKADELDGSKPAG
jgi:hypothetical protein